MGAAASTRRWIQTTATVGLFLSLIVILVLRLGMSPEAFAAWGWRIPFLLSILLFAISIWIRLQLQESPAFRKIKEEGRHSKAPLTEAFGRWRNARIALIALLGARPARPSSGTRASSTRCSS